MKSYLVIIAMLCFVSCKTAQTAMIVGEQYDEKKDETTLTMLPYGGISFPGKWAKFDYHRDSRQHYFRNADSTVLGVAKNPKDKYPVYKQGMGDAEFTKAFVAWDTAYWRKQGVMVNVLKNDAQNNYIIWQALDSVNHYVNTIFLYGTKNGYAYNFSGSSKVWDVSKMQQYLEDIYTKN